MSNRFRGTYAEINLNNIESNYNYVKSLLKNKSIMPVVKANAYGHGVIEVVRKLVSLDVNYFCVSLLEEALEIKEVFPDVNILVMGVVMPNDFATASSNKITLTISNEFQYQGLLEFDDELSIHLKVDTGMNRLGFKDGLVIKEVIKNIGKNSYINIEGIFTHFATADSDEKYYQFQLDNFKKILATIDYDFKMIHASNSSSTIKYEQNISFTTHCRLGISLYGLTLDKGMSLLKPAFKLKTVISEIKELAKGEYLGYGITYQAKENILVGVLPIGYADGFLRQNRDSIAEINGKSFNTIGTICMDQMFIEIDKTIKYNDTVTLFGGIISIDDVATRNNTINYEVVCQITSRVPREYI
ncbi:alanine racemase [Candidatus Izimaplasma bacterium ZiA1]|uniref:alanine racemase n=1 Tax=Candidatus Izimoplasma sp. ZiA1 TaxID=2024899 RepID=UPI00143BBB22